MNISVQRTILGAAVCGIWMVVGGAVSLAAADWSSEVITLEPKAGNTHPPVVTALAIHPGGGQLALGGDDHLVRIWDLREKRQTRVLAGHSDWVRTVSFSPSG